MTSLAPSSSRPADQIGPWIAAGVVATVGVAAAARPVVLALRNPNQALAVLTQPHRPWLYRAAQGAHTTALNAQRELFGAGEHIDDSVDAFRHAYGAGLLHLDAVRNHRLAPAAADRLVQRVGLAHERDGVQNPSSLSAAMDLENNDHGIRLAASLPNGPVAGAADALRAAALQAMDDGHLTRIVTAADGSTTLAPSVHVARSSMPSRA